MISRVCAFAVVILVSSSGCQVLRPIPIAVQTQQIAPELIDSEKSQIEVGRPNTIVDSVGWVLGIPSKILLWDRRIDNHRISEDTVLTMADYLEDNNLPHIKVRANQYAPLQDFKRLRKNKTVAWPWRYTFGVVTVAGETIFPGRVFGGDHFNPFTQTVHLFSDAPAIALHEAAHAKDFTRRTYQGTYAAAYLVFPLWHETIASEDVFAYLDERGENDRIIEANRLLYPAYGTYVGNGLGYLLPNASVPLYYGSVIAGHINGRMLNRKLHPSPNAAADHVPSASPSPTISAEQIHETEHAFASEMLSSDAPMYGG